MKTRKQQFLAIILVFFLISCTVNGLEITDNQQTKLAQRSSMIISGSIGDLELQLGDITGGRVDVKIYGIDDDKVYFQNSMTEGASNFFEYDGKKYRVKINHFEEHTFHDDYAFVEFRLMKE